jgi:hypothetical protein
MRQKILIIVFFIIFNIGFSLFNSTFAQDQNVIINIKKNVYHKTTCSVGKRCKKSCIKSSESRAINIYDARQCKICYKKKKSSKK